MSRGYRFAGSPKWVAGHLLVLVLVVTMVLLGRWQLDVSNSKHFALQNFGYALQWWAFSLFALVLWSRILRDVARNAGGASAASQPAEPAPVVDRPVAYRRYVMPQSTDMPAQTADPELAAYNAYLARLHAESETHHEGTAR